MLEKAFFLFMGVEIGQRQSVCFYLRSEMGFGHFWLGAIFKEGTSLFFHKTNANPGLFHVPDFTEMSFDPSWRNLVT